MPRGPQAVKSAKPTNCDPGQGGAPLFKPRLTLWTVSATALGGLLCFFAALANRPGEARTAATRPPPKHYVTPGQLTASGGMSRVTVALPVATDQDGHSVAWSELASGRPLVVVFIKDGCPCGVEFEPFFHRLARAYDGAVRFAGVIDADVAAARRYHETNRVPYPVFADPDRRIAAHFGITNGASVALVAPDGVIETVWPGCSADMMRELSARAARLAGVDERPFDLTGLPHALTAGCPLRP